MYNHLQFRSFSCCFEPIPLMRAAIFSIRGRLLVFDRFEPFVVLSILHWQDHCQHFFSEKQCKRPIVLILCVNDPSSNWFVGNQLSELVPIKLTSSCDNWVGVCWCGRVKPILSPLIIRLLSPLLAAGDGGGALFAKIDHPYPQWWLMVDTVILLRAR